MDEQKESDEEPSPSEHEKVVAPISTLEFPSTEAMADAPKASPSPVDLQFKVGD